MSDSPRAMLSLLRDGTKGLADIAFGVLETSVPICRSPYGGVVAQSWRNPYSMAIMGESAWYQKRTAEADKRKTARERAAKQLEDMLPAITGFVGQFDPDPLTGRKIFKVDRESDEHYWGEPVVVSSIVNSTFLIGLPRDKYALQITAGKQVFIVDAVQLRGGDVQLSVRPQGREMPLSLPLRQLLENFASDVFGKEAPAE